MSAPHLEAPTSVVLTGLVQGFLLICLFFALLSGATELAFFVFVVLSLGLSAWLWSRVSLKHARCEISLSRTKLFPGARLQIDIRAVNAKWLPALLRIDLRMPGALAGSDSDQWISEEAGLLSYQQAVFSREFFPDKRGVYNLGPPMLRSGDLFGFFFKDSLADARCEIVVYPRIVDIRPIPVPRRDFFGIPGAAGPIKDPILIFGTREYQPGSPARAIHWKASARHNRLQEKLCETAEQEKVLIVLDVNQFEKQGAAEAFEKTLEAIAAFVLQMDRRGVATGFASNARLCGGGSRIIPISRSTGQATSILETLARAEMKSVGSVTDFISRGYQLPWGVSSLCFAWARGEQARPVEVFMRQRSIPVRFVVAQKSADFGSNHRPGEIDTIYLHTVLSRENRKDESA